MELPPPIRLKMAQMAHTKWWVQLERISRHMNINQRASFNCFECDYEQSIFCSFHQWFGDNFYHNNTKEWEVLGRRATCLDTATWYTQ